MIFVSIQKSRLQQSSLNARSVLLTLSIHWACAVIMFKPFYGNDNSHSWKQLVAAMEVLLNVNQIKQSSFNFHELFGQCYDSFCDFLHIESSERFKSHLHGNLKTPLLFITSLAIVSEKGVTERPLKNNNQSLDTMKCFLRVITVHLVKLIVDKIPSSLYIANQDQLFPIHLAASSYNINGQSSLIISPNKKSANNQTSMISISLQLIQIMCLKNNSNYLLQLLSGNGQSVLHIATNCGDVETAAWIYQHTLESKSKIDENNSNNSKENNNERRTKTLKRKSFDCSTDDDISSLSDISNFSSLSSYNQKPLTKRINDKSLNSMNECNNTNNKRICMNNNNESLNLLNLLSNAGELATYLDNNNM